MTQSAIQLPELNGATPWTQQERPKRPEEFTFALLSDRTGGARPGVFEHAVDIVNLFRPDFAIQVGDLIEGYTEDPAELDAMWSEADDIVDNLEVPLFRVPGNHDVSNTLMRDRWLQRHGRLHYHFRYHDILFVVLDTQDPPEGQLEFYQHQIGDIDALKDLAKTDPDEATRRAGSIDWEGPHPVAFSAEQLDWAEQTLAENTDVRWTVLCMHMPVWQDPHHAGFQRLQRALASRPYTAFCGHIHNYKQVLIDGNAHIRLGPTGGLWVVDSEVGNFDHITLVTMTSQGPRIANVRLDGVLDSAGEVARG